MYMMAVLIFSSSSTTWVAQKYVSMSKMNCLNSKASRVPLKCGGSRTQFLDSSMWLSSSLRAPPRCSTATCHLRASMSRCKSVVSSTCRDSLCSRSMLWHSYSMEQSSSLSTSIISSLSLNSRHRRRPSSDTGRRSVFSASKFSTFSSKVSITYFFLMPRPLGHSSSLLSRFLVRGLHHLSPP